MKGLKDMIKKNMKSENESLVIEFEKQAFTSLTKKEVVFACRGLGIKVTDWQNNSDSKVADFDNNGKRFVIAFLKK